MEILKRLCLIAKDHMRRESLMSHEHSLQPSVLQLPSTSLMEYQSKDVHLCHTPAVNMNDEISYVAHLQGAFLHTFLNIR